MTAVWCCGLFSGNPERVSGSHRAAAEQQRTSDWRRRRRPGVAAAGDVSDAVDARLQVVLSSGAADDADRRPRRSSLSLNCERNCCCCCVCVCVRARALKMTTGKWRAELGKKQGCVFQSRCLVRRFPVLRFRSRVPVTVRNTDADETATLRAVFVECQHALSESWGVSKTRLTVRRNELLSTGTLRQRN